MSRFVQSYWISRNETPSPGRDRWLPTGTAQLVIDLSGDGLCVPTHSVAGRSQDTCLALFNGADTTYCLLESHHPVYRVGVDFKPGGAYPFFAPSAGELQNAHVPLEALWGVRATELWELLLGSPTVSARLQALEQALLAHVIRPLEQRPEVAFALREFGRTPRPRSIAAVANDVELSHARFIQVFRDEVGLSPKQFCRVRRFASVVQRSWKEEQPDWATLALEYGYYDQAHLTHDFQRFAGVSPGVFLRDRSLRFPTFSLLPTR